MEIYYAPAHRVGVLSDAVHLAFDVCRLCTSGLNERGLGRLKLTQR